MAPTDDVGATVLTKQISMKIEELGEFGLIRHVTEAIELKNQSSVKGVGDDCAVLRYDADREVLVTTDLLLEGVHFDLTYVPLKHLGYKSAVVNFSDVYAMGGEPRQITVSLGLSQRFSVEDIEELYAGLRLACEKYGVDIVGGDTSSSRSGMVITVTAVGEVAEKKIAYRSGARLHDLICVSGDLGSAYSGLLVLQREKFTFQVDPNFQPHLESYDYVLERYLKPEPRLAIVDLLDKHAIVPSAMIDVSDGLASELLHLCKQSGCGCEVYEERLPIDYQTSRVCSEMSKNMLPVSNALNGGEDFELLFTIHQSDYEKIKELNEIHIIGHITEEGSPAVMVTPQNTTIQLRAQGWQGNE